MQISYTAIHSPPEVIQPRTGFYTEKSQVFSSFAARARGRVLYGGLPYIEKMLRFVRFFFVGICWDFARYRKNVRFCKVASWEGAIY